MATFDVATAPSDVRRQNAERAFAAGGGPLTREGAAAVLAERYGITPPATDSQQSTYTPPTATAADYTVDLTGVELPDEADPIAVAAGAAEFGYALSLPPYLANVIGRDLAAGDPDPKVVEKTLADIGIDPAEARRVVDEMIQRGAVKLGKEIPVKAVDLSAFVVSQLYGYAQVEARRAKR